MRRSTAASIVGLVLMTLLLRWSSLSIAILNEDEALYASTAAAMQAGDLPYRAGVESKPPGIFYLYEAGFALFGRYNMIGLHALTIVWVLMTALLLAIIAERMRPGAGRLTALCYLVFTTTHDPKILATQCELMYSLPLAAAALSLFIALEDGPRARVLLAFPAGLFIAAATLIKPTAATLLGGAGLGMLAALLVSPHKLRTILAGLLVLGGFASGWGLAALYFQHLGVWNDLVYWAFGWTTGLYIPTGFRESFLVRRFFASMVPWLALTFAMWIPALAHARTVVRERRAAPLPLVGWMIAAYAALFIGGRFFDHYFAAAIPPFAVLAGPRLATWLDGAEPSRRRRVAFAVAVALPAALCLFGSLNFFATRRVLGDARHDESEAARWIAANSQPSDRVFVWGYYPLLYVSANRLPATRHIGCHYLTGYAALGLGRKIPPEEEDKLGVPGGWDTLFADLERNRPALIADTSPGNYHQWGRYPLTRYPQLLAYVTAHYDRVAEIDGVAMYRRR